jgi:tryptophanyl-tRNA synthetase
LAGPSVGGKDLQLMKRMFSGIQPTGSIHLGNYLGAIKQWVALQGEYDGIFPVVDLHAITIFQEPAKLKAKIRELACLLVAAGIDPKKSAIFVQSRVSAHAELAWILECVTPVGWLRRMTQFKDKAETAESVSAGLFAYPALMAADILLYRTDVVPVGEDQLQHLEITRDIAQRFNSLYGETFRLPEPIIPKKAGRIMALDDPTKKMSKSTVDPGHAIYLLDSPEDVRAKIARATTDSLREIRFDEARPGIHNLLVIYEMLSGDDRDKIESRFEGRGYSEFKRELSELVVGTLNPIQSKYRELASDYGFADSVLREGEGTVRPIAEATMATVKNRLGLD